MHNILILALCRSGFFFSVCDIRCLFILSNAWKMTVLLRHDCCYVGGLWGSCFIFVKEHFKLEGRAL